MSTDQPLRAPSRALFLLEGPRALGEFGLLAPGLPLLAAAPAGDGQPVMLLPGLGAGDLSTLPLRLYLRRCGYAVHGWGRGLNRGRLARLGPLLDRLAGLHARHGRPVSLVGWSLGGIYARELARRMPAEVQCVVTLGSPFRGPAEVSNADLAYRWLSGRTPETDPGLDQAPPVPTTAVYTTSDGVVPWQRCVEATPRADVESVRVRGSHMGLGHNPAVLYLVADRLAQQPAAWAPFRPPPAWRLLYPSHSPEFVPASSLR